jgi:hypothetical protein
METGHFGEVSIGPEAASARYEQNTFDVAIGKGSVILFDFFALRFPNHPVHNETLSDVLGNLDNGFREGESREMRIQREMVVELVKVNFDFEKLHNEPLIKPESEVEDKVAVIRHDFSQFGREIRPFFGGRIAGESTYERIISACELAYQTYGLGEFLTDASGRPLTVRDILPDEQVLIDMWDKFVMRFAMHCRSLNRFINFISENAE